MYVMVGIGFPRFHGNILAKASATNVSLASLSIEAWESNKRHKLN